MDQKPQACASSLATAAASHADVALISSVQSLRLFAMVLLGPLIIRYGTEAQLLAMTRVAVETRGGYAAAPGHLLAPAD